MADIFLFIRGYGHHSGVTMHDYLWYKSLNNHPINYNSMLIGVMYVAKDKLGKKVERGFW
jgi:hypothetical protein